MKVRFFAAFMLTVLTMLIYGQAAASAAPQPVNGPDTVLDYQLIVARHSGKCLDVAGASTVRGTPLIQWSCHGGANQQWAIVPSGSGSYFIVSKNSGDCADVAGASTAPGAPLIQWPCHGGANQQFNQIPTDNGYVLLVAVHSGQCVDVSGGSVADGAPVIQWPCHRGANQQWRIG